MVGEGRWGEEGEMDREERERGWMGSRSTQSLEGKSKKTKGVCVCDLK